jgi:hypothetical protein
VTLSPLPCWKNLSPEAYRQRVANLAAEIEEDAAAARKRTGAGPLGAAAILPGEVPGRGATRVGWHPLWQRGEPPWRRFVSPESQSGTL